jgi:hypothetical protein
VLFLKLIYGFVPISSLASKPYFPGIRIEHISAKLVPFIPDQRYPAQDLQVALLDDYQESHKTFL